jgi:RimJ/RimL family protein N-acetyltransferase
MSPIPILETQRLRLQPLALADADAIQRLFPTWQIVRFLGSHVPWPYPEDGARRFILNLALPAMAEGRQWHWTLRPRSHPEHLIGAISLMDEPDNNRGLSLSPSWQGQGLMAEACEAATAYWFEVLGKPLLRVPKAAPNLRSRRLSERSGMRLVAVSEQDYVSGRFATEIWEITREEWLRQNSRLQVHGHQGRPSRR